MFLAPLALAAPFDPARIHAAPFDPSRDFVGEVLAPIGPIARTDHPALGPDTSWTEYRAAPYGVRAVLGVACRDEIVASRFQQERDAAWGCRVGGADADTWGVPAGTLVSFHLPYGTLRDLVLPEGTTLERGAIACRGRVIFAGSVVTRCELAAPGRVGAVDLPVGTEVTFTPAGRPSSANVPGRVVEVAGRTWGPEYTPCGGFYFQFDEAGRLIPPAPDPTGETCCL